MHNFKFCSDWWCMHKCWLQGLLKLMYTDGFMERGFTSRRKGSVSVFSAAVCRIQASKCYIESFILVLKEKLLLSKWKIHCTAASWVHACPLEVGRSIDTLKPSTCIQTQTAKNGVFSIHRHISRSTTLQPATRNHKKAFKPIRSFKAALHVHDHLLN